MKGRCQQIAGVLCLILLFGAGCGGDLTGNRGKAVETYTSKATRLFEARDYTGAIAAYEELLRLYPDEGTAHFKIAQIYYGNLNDYLNASYHYQRFLMSPDPEPESAELARGFLENAKLLFAASIPNSGFQGTADTIRLKTENDALHRQIDELKQELTILQGQSSVSPPGVVEATTGATKTPPTPVVAPPTPVTPVAAVNTSKSGTIETANTKSPSDPLSIDSYIADTPKPKAMAPKTSSTPKKTTVKSKSRKYTVQKGDGIQAIAKKFYGDRSRWKDIVKANPGLKDPNVLKPGQVLIIP